MSGVEAVALITALAPLAVKAVDLVQTYSAPGKTKGKEFERLVLKIESSLATAKKALDNAKDTLKSVNEPILEKAITELFEEIISASTIVDVLSKIANVSHDPDKNKEHLEKALDDLDAKIKDLDRALLNVSARGTANKTISSVEQLGISTPVSPPRAIAIPSVVQASSQSQSASASSSLSSPVHSSLIQPTNATSPEEEFLTPEAKQAILTLLSNGGEHSAKDIVAFLKANGISKIDTSNVNKGIYRWKTSNIRTKTSQNRTSLYYL